MAGKINDGRVHGRNCRATSCDCPERKAAHAAYMRERRAKAKAKASQMGRLRAVGPSTADPAPSGATTVSDVSGGPLLVAALREIEAIPGVKGGHPLLVASMLALADRVDSGRQPQTAVSAIKLLAGLTAELRATPEAVRLVAVPDPTATQRLIAMLGSPL